MKKFPMEGAQLCVDENGNAVGVFACGETFPFLGGSGSGTDDQQLLPLTLENGVLTVTLEDGGTQPIDLSIFFDNVDAQQITGFEIVGDTLTISLENGGTASADLSQYLDNTDNQELSLAANILSLTNGLGPDTTVDLSPYLDNTDNQAVTTWAFDSNTNQLTIEVENGGGPQVVDLSSLEDTSATTTNTISGPVPAVLPDEPTTIPATVADDHWVKDYYPNDGCIVEYVTHDAGATWQRCPAVQAKAVVMIMPFLDGDNSEADQGAAMKTAFGNNETVGNTDNNGATQTVWADFAEYEAWAIATYGAGTTVDPVSCAVTPADGSTDNFPICFEQDACGCINPGNPPAFDTNQADNTVTEVRPQALVKNGGGTGIHLMQDDVPNLSPFVQVISTTDGATGTVPIGGTAIDDLAFTQGNRDIRYNFAYVAADPDQSAGACPPVLLDRCFTIRDVDSTITRIEILTPGAVVQDISNLYNAATTMSETSPGVWQLDAEDPVDPQATNGALKITLPDFTGELDLRITTTGVQDLVGFRVHELWSPAAELRVCGDEVVSATDKDGGNVDPASVVIKP